MTGSKNQAAACGEDGSSCINLVTQHTGDRNDQRSGTPSCHEQRDEQHIRYALEGTAMSPSLAATPSAASFGNVPETTTNTLTIQLKNTGSRSVTVTGTSLSVSGYHVSGLTLPLTLAAGAITHFNLAFSPTTTGLHTGSLIVTTSNPNAPLVINVSGTGILATRTLAVTPTTLDFGSETVGKTHVLTANLKNTGNGGRYGVWDQRIRFAVHDERRRGGPDVGARTECTDERDLCAEDSNYAGRHG
jgi:hypothetical protein